MIDSRRTGTLARLGALTLLVELLALLGVWLLSAQSMRDAETGALATWSGRLLPSLADDYAPMLGGGRLEALEAQVARDAQRMGVRITVADPDGEVLADSVEGAARAVSIRHDPEVAGALAHGEGVAVREGVRRGEAVLAARRFQRDDAEGVVRLAADAMPMGEARRLALRAVWPAGLALLAATGAMFLLAGRLTRGSLRRLQRDVRRVASGERRVRLKRPLAGEHAPLAGAINDALDAMQAEIDRRRMKHRKSRAVVRSMPGAVLALDSEQRVMSVNRAGERLLGLKEREARGRLIQEIVADEALHRFVQSAFDTDEPASDEFEIDADPPATVQAASRALVSPGREVVGRVVVLQDITTLRRLERMRRDFAANVSHELRTPITNIKGYIETLQEMQGEDPRRAAGFLAVVARNVDRLSMIVEGMLDLARLEDPTAAGALETTPCEAGPLLETVCARMREEAEARAVRLTTRAEPGAGARMNARLVEQALQNLIANAIRHGREAGAVRVEAAMVGDEGDEGPAAWLELSVEDDGPGVEKRHQERIFERFYRADPSRRRDRDSGGAGLGLAIVKHIAKLHGGVVGVRSAVGRGSRFWMRFPVQDSAIPNEAREAQPEP